MTGFPPPRDPGALHRLNSLADAVMSDLLVAGLPVAPESSPLGTGARVLIDNVEYRGVLVSWKHHFILTSASQEAWGQGDPGGPNGRLVDAIAVAMQDAMLTILEAAGYEVAKETWNDYAPHDLLVSGRKHPTPWREWYTTQFQERYARMRTTWNGRGKG